jgi:transposase
MDAHPPLPPEIWEHTPPAAQELIVAQAATVAQLRAEMAQLRETVEELARRLGRNSRNSSQPPSADPPHAVSKRPRREPSGRQPGGQPGHEGQTRVLLPVEAVDVLIPLKPVQCLYCQHPLGGEDPQPQRHQVTEIPPLKPVVTEYQLHRLVCPACGAATRAELPSGVPTGEFGPRVQAITALCTGAYHLSKRATQRAMDDLFGLSMSVGTIANLEQATVQAVAAPMAEARAYVQAQPAAYVDETGWREGRQRAWLWTTVTSWVTVFVVRRSRSAAVAQELLGEDFWGWLVTDRWSAYGWYPTWRRQLCWAHLLRDIEAMVERGERSREIGEALQAQARQMFHCWQRVRDGTLAHPSFASYMWPIRREVERLLEAGQTCGVPKTEGVCREILKRRQALWTFVRHAGVEPTNNAAERAIRPGVLWRKGSFGTQSPEGSRFVEAMMTVVATLKQQHRNVLDYLTAACEAVLCDEPAPSLLPNPDQLNEIMRSAA